MYSKLGTNILSIIISIIIFNILNVTYENINIFKHFNKEIKQENQMQNIEIKKETKEESKRARRHRKSRRN